MRLMALMVPKPDPVEMANNPEKRNVTIVKLVPPMFILLEIHTSPSIMCPSFKMLPYTPTINQSRMAVMAVLLPKNSKMVCQ